MKSFRSLALLAVLAVGALTLAACATATGSPTDQQVAGIKNACAIDKGLRPTVQALAVLATPDEQRALTVAEAGIDVVCANPAGSLQENTLTIFSEDTAQVVNIVAQLQSRKARAAAPGAK